jgi:HECT-domain (ubiquitin-transferase)
VTLQFVLVFATRADEVPPLGFKPQPEITFQHDSQFSANHGTHNSKYPLASPCANRLMLSKTYNDFKADMEDCILQAPGFGFE